jgi:hypothetical protein
LLKHGANELSAKLQELANGASPNVVPMEKMMAEIERDKISDGQIEEAEQDAADPSHEKNPADREDDQSGDTDVNE